MHDCFAVTANSVPLLIYKLKMVYLKMYSSNTYLLDFDYTIRFTINKTFGDKIFPLKGSEVIKVNGKKLIKLPFPDVNKVVNKDYNIDNLEKSSYPII